MELQVDKCPKCGNKHTILPSNNPLNPGICTSCVIKTIDYNDLKQGDFFCRSYNLPFNITVWINMAKEYKQNMFKHYVAEFIDYQYQHEEENLWEEVNEEWKLIKTHEELLAKIEPIKEGYMLRNQIKWGEYTFSELISLENLFVSTLKANDVTNPMQKDAIKKACKMSIALDKAINQGDSKSINELSKAYQNFVKTAKIDDLIIASSKDVISNVAELVDFIEKSGFEFTYYDDVERDVVDKSINDIKSFITRLVSDSTGLESMFETLTANRKKKEAKDKDEESFQEVSLEELYQKNTQAQSAEPEEFVDIKDDFEDEDEDF